MDFGSHHDGGRAHGANSIQYRVLKSALRSQRQSKGDSMTSPRRRLGQAMLPSKSNQAIMGASVPCVATAAPSTTNKVVRDVVLTRGTAANADVRGESVETQDTPAT